MSTWTTHAAIELDMRDLLRAKKARLSDESKETGDDFSFLVSQISGQSVHEIDHLIEGLRGVRKKLDKDGDRLHREIEQYAAFSQSIIELTKIVSDGMASVNKAPTAVPELRTLLVASSVLRGKKKVPTRCRDFKVFPSRRGENSELHQHSESTLQHQGAVLPAQSLSGPIA